MAAPKKPRIRKTAPTVRERVEQTKAKEQQPKRPSRLRPVLSKVASPAAKLPRPNVPQNKVTAFIGKVLNFIAPRYFVNAWRELRQVTWPNRRETWRLTGAVFIFATVFGALVAGTDKVLDIIFKNLVLK